MKIKRMSNQCVDAENEAGSRVLLSQHPRPFLISGHDRRWEEKERQLKKTMKVLITGSSGKIGRAIFKTVSAHYETIGIDLLPGEFTHFTGDVCDRTFVSKAMSIGGVDDRDVADAHFFALFRPTKEFQVYNVSGPTPFHKSETKDLYFRAHEVILKHFPWAKMAFKKQGWDLPKSIDRVYISEKAKNDLGYKPKYDFQYFINEKEICTISVTR